MSQESTIGSTDSRVDVDGSSLLGSGIDVLSPLASDGLKILGTSNHFDNGANDRSQQGREQGFSLDRPAVVGTEQAGSFAARVDFDSGESLVADSLNHFPSLGLVKDLKSLS